MKRIRVMLGFLLAGAIVNVAVAFGAAAFMVPIRESEISPKEIQALMDEQTLSDWDQYDAIIALEHTSLAYSRIDLHFGFRDSHTDPMFTDPIPLNPAFLIHVRIGWPMACFHGWYIEAKPSNVTDHVKMMDQRAIPYQPAHLALSVNTLSYAAMLAGVVISIRQGHRRVRVARGLCVKCGYDLKGADHEACPECGVVVGRTNIA